MFVGACFWVSFFWGACFWASFFGATCFGGFCWARFWSNLEALDRALVWFEFPFPFWCGVDLCAFSFEFPFPFWCGVDLCAFSFECTCSGGTFSESVLLGEFFFEKLIIYENFCILNSDYNFFWIRVYIGFLIIKTLN